MSRVLLTGEENIEIEERAAIMEWEGAPSALSAPIPEHMPVILPEIDVSFEDLAAQAKVAWEAITKANDRKPILFRRGTFVRIEHGSDGAIIIREVNVDRLRHLLARTVRFVQPQTRQHPEGPALPPVALVRDLLATPDPPLPELLRIVETPVFASDGSIQRTQGYNPAAKIFYEPATGLCVPAVPLSPTVNDVIEAREVILDLISDFPFISESERAHAVELLLLPFARDLIDGPTPLHLIEKPIPGTGATLLVDVLTYPATGRSIGIMVEGRDEDEWRKRILAKLTTAPTYISFDNLRRRLDSAAVSAAITARQFEDRRLGHTEMISVPVTCGWIATGNNPAISTEIARRTVRIRLDPRMDRPWLREGFRHPDLLEYAARQRGRLIAAALTLIQFWIYQSRPVPPNHRRLGMFESWSDVMAGILHAAGIPGFLGNLETFYEASDLEGTSWRGFIEAWWDKFAGTDVVVSDLFEFATDLNLGDGTERSQKTRLGKFLADRKDRRFGDFCLRKATVIRGQQRWRLEH